MVGCIADLHATAHAAQPHFQQPFRLSGASTGKLSWPSATAAGGFAPVHTRTPAMLQPHAHAPTSTDRYARPRLPRYEATVISAYYMRSN